MTKKEIEREEKREEREGFGHQLSELDFEKRSRSLDNSSLVNILFVIQTSGSTQP